MGCSLYLSVAVAIAPLTLALPDECGTCGTYEPVESWDCPDDPTTLMSCFGVCVGEVCISTNDCGTDGGLANCGTIRGTSSVFRKVSGADPGCARCTNYEPIASSDCPADVSALQNCWRACPGDLCAAGRSFCDIDRSLNNCGYESVYRKLGCQCGTYEPIVPADCPASYDLRALGICCAVAAGELCYGDGQCGADDNLNNCRDSFNIGYHVYRKVSDDAPSTTTTTADPGCRSCGTYTPVVSSDCPAGYDVFSLPNCLEACPGELCEGDGECGTDINLNNCNWGGVFSDFDVYLKVTGGTCENKEWDQCGGHDFTGSDCCPDYDKCVDLDPYFSQCQPDPADPCIRRRWDQCGGVDRDGKPWSENNDECCPDGFVCSYVNDWYSQCLWEV